MAVLIKAWALIAPWAGKWLLTLLPWLLPAWKWSKALIPAVISGVLLGAVVLGWWALRETEGRVPISQVKQLCEDANLRARLDATEQALRQAELTLQIRGRALRLLERQIEALREEREALRAAAPDTTAIVFDADDPWLRTGSTR